MAPGGYESMNSTLSESMCAQYWQPRLISPFISSSPNLSHGLGAPVVVQAVVVKCQASIARKDSKAHDRQTEKFSFFISPTISPPSILASSYLDRSHILDQTSTLPIPLEKSSTDLSAFVKAIDIRVLFQIVSLTSYGPSIIPATPPHRG